MTLTPASRRMILLAALIFALDQAAKNLVLQCLGPAREKILLPGFFKLVCWTNTGAAWSFFHNRNGWLAAVSILALLCLVAGRRHFHVHTLAGQLSLSLICGGILGNLFDRIERHQVIDFIRFYLHPRGGEEIGFPAFNVADSAICVGVALLILLSFRLDAAAAPPAPKSADGALKTENGRG
ncbi:MAG: signal peptidase II [Verrucomicrobiota bacterium]|jgi:signal peptidase II